MRPDTRGLRLRCEQCGRTGEEGWFVPAVNPERRAVFGQIYSDVECPRCGALVYPVPGPTPRSPASTVVVLHERGQQRSVYVAHCEVVIDGELDQRTARRVARQLGIDLAAAPGARLWAVAVETDQVQTVRL